MIKSIFKFLFLFLLLTSQTWAKGSTMIENVIQDYFQGYQQADIYWGQKNEYFIVAIAAFISGVIANIPKINGMEEDFFFQRNIGFVVFPMLMLYFAWKQKYCDANH